MNEFIGLLVGFILTLFIYSFIAGDNALYRLAVHTLLGVTAAYATVLVVQRVFLPIYHQISTEPESIDSLMWLIPLVLALLLILKLIRPVARLGNNAVAAIIGVGAAVGMVGAIGGTLLPQLWIPGNDNLLITIGAAAMTICTLLFFQFTGRAGKQGELVLPRWQRPISLVGRAVLAITFGALFAGLLSTSLVLLVERVSTFLNGFISIIGVWFP